MSGKSATALKLKLQKLKPLLVEIINHSRRLRIDCRHANMLRFMLVMMNKNKLARSKLNECYTLLDNLHTIYSLFASISSPSSATFRGSPESTEIFDPNTRSYAYRISVNHEQLINSVGITVDTILENFDFESIAKTSEPKNKNTSMEHNAKSKDRFNKKSSRKSIPYGYEKYFSSIEYTRLDRLKPQKAIVNFRWAQANRLNNSMDESIINVKRSLLGNSDLSWLKGYKIPKVTPDETKVKVNVNKDQIRVKEFAKKFLNVNFLINRDENEMSNKNHLKWSAPENKCFKTIIKNAVENLHFDVRTLNEEYKKQHPKKVQCLQLIVKKKVLNNPSFGHLINILTDYGKLDVFNIICENSKENTGGNIDHVKLDNPEVDSLKSLEVESRSQEMEFKMNVEDPGENCTIKREPRDNHSVNSKKLNFEINNDEKKIQHPSTNPEKDEVLKIEDVVSLCLQKKPILKVKDPSDEDSSVKYVKKDTIQACQSFSTNQQESLGIMQIETEINSDIEDMNLFPEITIVKDEYFTEIKSEPDEVIFT